MSFNAYYNILPNMHVRFLLMISIPLFTDVEDFMTVCCIKYLAVAERMCTLLTVF